MDLTSPVAVLKRIAEIWLENESLVSKLAVLMRQVEENDAEWAALAPVAAHYLGNKAIPLCVYDIAETRPKFVVLTAVDGSIMLWPEGKPEQIDPMTIEEAQKLQASRVEAVADEAKADLIEAASSFHLPCPAPKYLS